MRTKEIRIKGKKYRLTSEEIYKVDLIKKGLVVQEKLEPLLDELKRIKGTLAEMAIARKGTGRIVRLDGILGEAVITWKRKIIVDPGKADALKKILGKREFSKFFDEVVEHRPTKDLNILLRTKGKDANKKKISIMEALTIKENGPYIEIRETPVRRRKRCL